MSSEAQGLGMRAGGRLSHAAQEKGVEGKRLAGRALLRGGQRESISEWWCPGGEECEAWDAGKSGSGRVGKERKSLVRCRLVPDHESVSRSFQSSWRRWRRKQPEGGQWKYMYRGRPEERVVEGAEKMLLCT